MHVERIRTKDPRRLMGNDGHPWHPSMTSATLSTFLQPHPMYINSGTRELALRGGGRHSRSPRPHVPDVPHTFTAVATNLEVVVHDPRLGSGVKGRERLCFYVVYQVSSVGLEIIGFGTLD